MTLATHITPALSFGEPDPTYPCINGNALTPPQINELIADGGSVHVDTFEQAAAVLAEYGMTFEQIQHQLAIADGSWAESVLGG